MGNDNWTRRVWASPEINLLAEYVFLSFYEVGHLFFPVEKKILSNLKNSRKVLKSVQLATDRYSLSFDTALEKNQSREAVVEKKLGRPFLVAGWLFIWARHIAPGTWRHS